MTYLRRENAKTHKQVKREWLVRILGLAALVMFSMNLLGWLMKVFKVVK